MSKILKPYTIIPSNLYVHRAADRQVKHIIKDLGRPGYVLVSRQMGKTNLLINAKRELETADDVFVYIDLSNAFDTLRGCFENIINTIIETNDDKFHPIIADLLKKRNTDRDLPPHKQHLNELRTLLKTLRGKLVIILDEIDALTKTNYSDQVFSQIRSIYFSRVNYSELMRLTYLLSGVIEPTEIIKDPKISPFNIGQKIFLNDFTKEEFAIFLEKAGMSDMSNEVKERIFYWTGGHPRMTWDVCSEVENLRKDIDIDPTKIDDIIKEIYLISFDKPPVDSIRELAKSDRELRNAVVEIEFNKGAEVSAKRKSKLYLAGIINYQENDVKIKNNIIRESLNLEWIRSVDEEERGLLRIASDLYEDEKYGDALATYEKFLMNNEFPEEKRALYFYRMGHAAFREADFRKALNYLEKANLKREDSEKLFFTIYNLRGSAHFYLKEFELSMSNYRTVIENCKIDEQYAGALINYGSAALELKKEADREDALVIFDDIINERKLDKTKIPESLLNELKFIACYNLSRLETKGDPAKAKQYLYQAIQYAEVRKKPFMMLTLLHQENNLQEQVILLRSLVELITTESIAPVQANPEDPLDFTYTALDNVIAYSYLYDRDNSFEEIKNCSRLQQYVSQIPRQLFNLAMAATDDRNLDNTITILRELNIVMRKGDFETDVTIEYLTAKYLAYFVDNRQELDWVIDYIKLFEKKRITTIDYVDFAIFANVIYLYLEKSDFSNALRLIQIIESAKSEIDKSLLINFAIIYYFEFKILLSSKKLDLARSKAENILALCKNEELKLYKDKLVDAAGLETIQHSVETFLNLKKQIRTPTTVQGTFGRNERIKVQYKDGHIKEAKFKKLESDIKSGKCKIILETT